MLVLATAVLPALAAPATCEVRGTIVDADGNPIAGAKIVYSPAGNPETTYGGKTNKKGKYYIPGMFSASTEGRWHVTIEAEGYLPVEMEVETRTVNNVLADDIRTTKLKPRAAIPEVLIRPMGNARIDFKMESEAALAEAAPAAPTGTPGEAAGAAAAAPKQDPWTTALERVNGGDLEGSVEFFEEAIAEKPDDAERQQSMAKVLYQLGRYDEAEPYAQKAIELAPDQVDGYMVLSTVYVGASKPDKAEATLLEARKIAPEDRRILQQLASLAIESGNTSGAMAAYESLVQLDPSDAESWLALADLYADSGQMDKSAEAYGQVVALDPEGAPQVFFNLGALLMNKPDRSADEVQRAITAFRKAIELKPDYREAHKQLAFALLGTGDRAGAKSELETCLNLAPDAPDAAQMNALIRSLK